MPQKDIILDEESRSKLDGIVSQMQANNESDEDIQFVVNDFKSKYGTSPKQLTSSQGAKSGSPNFVQAPKPQSGLASYTEGSKTLTSTSPSASTSSVGVGSKSYEPTLQDINKKITQISLSQRYPEQGEPKSFAEANKEAIARQNQIQVDETEQRRKERRISQIPNQLAELNKQKVDLLKENTFESKKKLASLDAVSAKLSNELEQANKPQYEELVNLPKNAIKGLESEIHEYLNTDQYTKEKIQKVSCLQAGDNVFNEKIYPKFS